MASEKPKIVLGCFLDCRHCFCRVACLLSGPCLLEPSSWLRDILMVLSHLYLLRCQ